MPSVSVMASWLVFCVQQLNQLGVEPLADRHLAVLGDAAFVAGPHVGAGVTKAALDALCLVETIAAAVRSDDPRMSSGGSTPISPIKPEAGPSHAGSLPRSNGIPENFIRASDSL
jgi:hypothetical protein